jgi:hypothetical protein
MISRTSPDVVFFDPTGHAAAAADTPDATTRYAGRNASLDVLRLAAAFVIVLFHAKSPGGQFMPMAMAVFTAIMGYLALGDHGDRPFAALVRKRAYRLLRPLLIWGAFYAALRIADAVAAREPLGQTLVAWLPPQGTMGALWFLPFAFVASLALSAIRRALPAIATPAVALPLAGILSILWVPMLNATQPAPAIAVYLDYVQALFFGVALAAASGSRPLTLLTGLVALGIGLSLRFGGFGNTQPLEIGVPILACALLMPRPGTGFTQGAADLSMAVYLIHVFVLAVALRLLPFPVGSLGLGIVGISVSGALGLLLMRSRIGQRLI